MLELETYITDAVGIKYDSLEACHMWRTVLGEREYTLDDTMRSKSQMEVRQFWRGGV